MRSSRPEIDNTLPVTVVPEGLAYDVGAKEVLLAPSFVGEVLLRHVLEHYATCRILIAPANSFGAFSPEHEVMAAWLMKRGCARVETPPVAFGRYVDTWRNASELRCWLSQQEQWPLGPMVLVAAFRHARRARLCFERNGFNVASLDTVTYSAEGAPIVPRLFYYNWPFLHRLYEWLAFVRDAIRPLSTRGTPI
jgi:hypothetical protein